MQQSNKLISDSCAITLPGLIGASMIFDKFELLPLPNAFNVLKISFERPSERSVESDVVLEPPVRRNIAESISGKN